MDDAKEEAWTYTQEQAINPNLLCGFTAGMVRKLFDARELAPDSVPDHAVLQPGAGESLQWAWDEVQS
jgi:hypothetical protein